MHSVTGLHVKYVFLKCPRSILAVHGVSVLHVHGSGIQRKVISRVELWGMPTGVRDRDKKQKGGVTYVTVVSLPFVSRGKLSPLAKLRLLRT